eukprot:TRINITY_DN3107_c0_g1_i1.p2 TRINITY_DN3107_c0_g1~~TRINITY_DN3107_c0_g1_i1.p2  ORF type:complete len:239 (-),score=27.69 TRINITY_DN3107_c0_g1_i1:122-838(-)
MRTGPHYPRGTTRPTATLRRTRVRWGAGLSRSTWRRSGGRGTWTPSGIGSATAPDVRRPEDAWLRCVDEGTVPTAVIVPSPVAPAEAAPPVPGVQEDYAALLGMLQEGERVSGALWRLRGAAPLRDTFQHLVEVVGRLVEAGAYTLCDADPAEVRRLAEGARERERRTAAAAGLPWEFAWGATDGARQGPFPAHTMHAWKQAAFFSADRLAYARPAAVDMFAAEEPSWAEAHLIDYLA